MDENVFGGGLVTSATRGNSETERITRRLIFQNENFTADFSEFQQVMHRLLADQGRRKDEGRKWAAIELPCHCRRAVYLISPGFQAVLLPIPAVDSGSGEEACTFAAAEADRLAAAAASSFPVRLDATTGRRSACTGFGTNWAADQYSPFRLH
jgi:hypothetical protein